MSYFDRVKKLIDRNLENEFNAIPFTLPRLNSYVPGITKGNYCIITASEKVGKSTLCDELYLYGAYEFCIANNIPLKIFYWSMEMSLTEKIIKGIIRNIYKSRKIVVDRKDILSLSANRMSQELYDIIMAQRVYFEKFEDIVTLFEGQINPTGTYTEINKYMEANGKMENGHYVANNPDEFVVGVMDHISLVGLERGMDKRQCIEKQSEYCMLTRNKYDMSWAVVQQQSMDKNKAQYTNSGATVENKHEPTTDGLGDAKTTARDANLLLSLYQPQRYNITKHLGRDISQYRDKYRCLKVLLNREGEADLLLPLYFDGRVSEIREL